VSSAEALINGERRKYPKVIASKKADCFEMPYFWGLRLRSQSS